jgi:3D (Asp-Asp-Asp) domain-containing protein
VRRPARVAAPLLLTVIGCLICGAVGAASGADTPITQGRKAELRRANGTLETRLHNATLDLYALDSQLQRTHDQLASLSAQSERVTQERASVRLHLDVTRKNALTAERRLGSLVRNLYEQQSSDPLAIVLGAQSLDEMISTLDDLSRSAQSNQQVVQVSRHARNALTTLAQKLDREDAHLHALEEAAARTEASLAATRGAHNALVSKLTAQRALNNREIAKIDAAATAAASAAPAPVAAAAPAPVASAATAAPAPAGAHSLTVTATGYSTQGTTATGLPVGSGTIAVDPSVIPLGTRVSVPGYGEAVAADTGSAVVGATIDLWFPTTQQALDWGRRIVTVTLH